MEINKDDLYLMGKLKQYKIGIIGWPIIGMIFYSILIILIQWYSVNFLIYIFIIHSLFAVLSFMIILFTYKSSVRLLTAHSGLIIASFIWAALWIYAYITKGTIVLTFIGLTVLLMIVKFYLGYRVELKRTREPFFKKNVKLGNIDLENGVVNLFGGMYYPSSYAFNKDILKENNLTRLLYVATIYFFFTDTDFKFTTYTSLGLVPAYYIAVNMMSMAGQRYAFARIIRKWEVANNRKLKTDLGVLMEKCDKINESLVKQGKKPINFFWRAMRGKVKGLEGLSV